MKERPILFSSPMVLALLAGTKTQTRRVVKWRDLHEGLNLGSSGLGVERTWRADGSSPEWVLGAPTSASWEWRSKPTPCPYGQSGDRLWVREAWAPDPPIDSTWASTEWNGCGRRIDGVPERFQHPAFCLYRAGWLHGDLTWRPGIHMPRWASRITLEVTEVRVERLQDISEADAIAEGVEPVVVGEGWRRYDPCNAIEAAGLMPCETARGSYRSLWESINGPGSWDENPFVWCVSFKRLT